MVKECVIEEESETNVENPAIGKLEINRHHAQKLFDDQHNYKHWETLDKAKTALSAVGGASRKGHRFTHN